MSSVMPLGGKCKLKKNDERKFAKTRYGGSAVTATAMKTADYLSRFRPSTSSDTFSRSIRKSSLF